MTEQWAAEFAELLQGRMRERGLSQAALARAARVHADTIRKLTSGLIPQPRDTTLMAVAGALGWRNAELVAYRDGGPPPESTVNPSIGQVLQQRMDELGLKQADAAEIAGVAVGTIRGILAADRLPRRMTLARIADALDLPEILSDTLHVPSTDDVAAGGQCAEELADLRRRVRRLEDLVLDALASRHQD